MTKLTVTFRNFAKAVPFPAVTTIELVTEGTLSVPASRIHTVLQHYHRTTDESRCLSQLDRLEVLSEVLLEYQRVTPCRWALSVIRRIVLPSSSWSSSWLFFAAYISRRQALWSAKTSRKSHRRLALSGCLVFIVMQEINPLNPELNPICYLLALLAHHFLHVSRIRVKSLTIRLLMSYIYIYTYIWSAYSWCF